MRWVTWNVNCKLSLRIISRPQCVLNLTQVPIQGFEKFVGSRNVATYSRVPTLRLDESLSTSDAAHLGTINSARHASGVSPRGQASPTAAQESPRRRGSQLADVVRQEIRNRSSERQGLQRKDGEANGAKSHRKRSPRRHSTSPERKSSEKPGAVFLDHLRVDHPGA